MTAASASPDPSDISCHNCGKAGSYKTGCAVPVKAYGKSNKPAGQKKKSGSGGGARQKWCSVHKTTTHNDGGCYEQGAPCLQASSTHTAAAMGTQIRPNDTENTPAVNFDDDFGNGSVF